MHRLLIQRALHGLSVDDVGGAHERLERNCLSTRAVVEEVNRRIHVRTRVNTEVETAQIRRGATADRRRALQVDLGISGVHEHSISEWNRDIEDLHAVLTLRNAHVSGFWVHSLHLFPAIL